MDPGAQCGGGQVSGGGRDWFKAWTDLILETFADVPVRARGVWLTLHAYCARYHPGTEGRIPGAKRFAAGKWQRCGGLKRKDVDEAVEAGLVRWEGDDLAIEHYDVRGEEELDRKRIGGSKGGRNSAKSRAARDSYPIDELAALPVQIREEERRLDQTRPENTRLAYPPSAVPGPPSAARECVEGKRVEVSRGAPTRGEAASEGEYISSSEAMDLQQRIEQMRRAIT